MSRQENLGDYSSDDDDICTSNMITLRTFKTRKQHRRNLNSQKFLCGFTALFVPNFKTVDRGIDTFLWKVIMAFPCASAINVCLKSIFRCILHRQRHQKTSTSSGYSSSEEW